MSQEEMVREGNRETTDTAAGALVALVVGFALGLIIAWIYWMEREERPESPLSALEGERVTLEPRAAASRGEPAAEDETAGEREPDDLTHVEGIGPKVSSLLQDAGIGTFERLAERDPDTLKEMLREEGLPFLDPSTWPEQAALAAVGAWDALATLQEELRAGRRV